MVLAHVFAAGGAGSESERELSIGGLDIVPTSHFNDFTYSALGHLHGRQELAPSIRYSGSPIPYSFSEAGHSKGAWVLEMTAEGLGEVKAVDWPATETTSHPAREDRRAAHRRAIRFGPGRLVPDHAHRQAPPGRRHGTAAQQVPGHPGAELRPRGKARRTAHSYADRLAAAKSPMEVCSGFVEHVRKRPLNEAEGDLLVSVLAQVRSEKVEK